MYGTFVYISLTSLQTIYINNACNILFMHVIFCLCMLHFVVFCETINETGKVCYAIYLDRTISSQVLKYLTRVPKEQSLAIL